MEDDYENTTTDENPIEDLLVESKCKLMIDIYAHYVWYISINQVTAPINQVEISIDYRTS